jgi:hypothetical protein
MAMKITLAYHNRETITTAKSFVVLTPTVNFIKHFFFISDEEAIQAVMFCPWRAFLA